MYQSVTEDYLWAEYSEIKIKCTTPITLEATEFSGFALCLFRL
jgi:hypothetical protein